MNIETVMAWFTSEATGSTINIQLGIVDVEAKQNAFNDITVKSLGTSDTYVRARLIPQWTNPNLSVNNIIFNFNTRDWIAGDDGYYYFKYFLKEGEETSSLLKHIIVDDLALTSEYEGESLNLKVVAEGVQTAHEFWRELWEIDDLPFTPENPWTP